MSLKKNKISRTDFIKTSGAALGGVVTLSHYACSGDLSSLKELIIGGNANYSLVTQTKANDKEKNAAKQLQLHLSKISKTMATCFRAHCRIFNACKKIIFKGWIKIFWSLEFWSK